ncbi:MAG: hypothetical protein V4613_03630 [Bacteroidota bacterium]
MSILTKLKTATKGGIGKLSTTIKKVAKPVEGGSFVGNALRVTANSATKGLLGNGLMLKSPGQTVEGYKEQITSGIKDIFAGAVIGANTDGLGDAAENAVNTTSKIKAMIKPVLLFVVLPIVLIVVVVKFVRKKKDKK